MEGFVQVGDCLVNVLDSLVTKPSPFTAGVHEVELAVVKMPPWLPMRGPRRPRRAYILFSWALLLLVVKRPGIMKRGPSSRNEEGDTNSVSPQNAKAQVVRPLQYGLLGLDIGRAPDTANCPDFFAPIN